MESGSANPELTRRFYADLFDWGTEVHAFPDGGSYTRFLLRDLPVAGAFSVEADNDLARLPTQWWPFVSVASVAAALNRAVALGASPLGDVVNVPGEFAAAEFIDPSGAICGVWQADAHTGAQFIGEAGALSWTDLSTPDPSAAVAFYEALFGWAHASVEACAGSYKFFTLDGEVVAGLSRSDSPEASWWRPHVGVNDFDTALASALEFGGDVGAEVPYVAGLARRAMVADPNGIRLMVIESETYSGLPDAPAGPRKSAHIALDP